VLHLKVVGRFACLSDPGSYTSSAGTAVPGRFSLAGQVPGERSDELQHLVLQVGGWAKGR